MTVRINLNKEKKYKGYKKIDYEYLKDAEKKLNELYKEYDGTDYDDREIDRAIGEAERDLLFFYGMWKERGGSSKVVSDKLIYRAGKSQATKRFKK